MPKENIKFHFYDIECLTNMFMLTVYLPEENKVEQYYLADKNYAKLISQEPDLLSKIQQRVNLRNANFRPNRIIKRSGTSALPGNGISELINLANPKNIVRLAREFGLSNADDAANPLDLTNTYPNGLRLTADTDKPNGDSKWQTQAVINRYRNQLNHIIDKKDDQKYLRFAKRNALYTKQELKDLSTLHYHEYDNRVDPYLIGYNSYNYDLTILAIFLAGAFNEVNADSLNAKIMSFNQTGFHYFDIQPDTPETMRNINNAMFSEKFKNQMPAILYKARDTDIKNAKDIDFHNAFMIRKNMLRSGRHLDAAKLNEKLNKVGLKRLLGIKGYQILQSDKLRPGTDTLTDIDQFYELLAYNASDCINLAALFDDNQYIGNFTQKEQLLQDYPMIVYAKKPDEYAPDIAPNRVKKNRMTIDSTSAQIATNVVCPYGHLKDIQAVNLLYPEKHKAKETGIEQFNVLKLTEDFFNKNVYQPALKLNKKNAEQALARFNVVMDYYKFIENKNFNDSAYYFTDQLLPFNHDPRTRNAMKHMKDEDYKTLFQQPNTFTWLKIKQELANNPNLDKIFTFTDAASDLVFNLPYQFISKQKIAPIPNLDENLTSSNQFKPLTIGDLLTYLGNKACDLDNLINQLNPPLENIYANSKTPKLLPYSDFEKVRQLVEKLSTKYLNFKLTLNAQKPGELVKQQLINVKTCKRMYQMCMRPYTDIDLPKGNYCLPFYKPDCSPSSGYAVFSIGGVHGAEYDQELYNKDHAEFNKIKNQKRQQLLLTGFAANSEDQNSKEKTKTAIWEDRHALFRKSKNGLYSLNSRYTFTSIDNVNHEDFSSYYPSLCRMLNVYWNDGIGYDIYGTIYDKKEKLGRMKSDPKYSKAQRAYFTTMRQGTKLILNSTTGKGDTHGQNSPIQMNNNIITMRLIGQMFTWRIGQAQTLLGAICISTNTDGIYTVLDDVELNAKSLAKQSATIHVRIDPERLHLISKDTNNRIESDVKTHHVNTASGGSLRAFNGPTTTGRLAHPGVIDRALGLYLLQMADQKSSFYDPRLRKPFNIKLGLKILTHLLDERTNNKDLSLSDKQKLLNFYQNIIASSPSSQRFIFTLKDYLPNINDLTLLNKKQKNNPVMQQLSFFDDQSNANSLSKDDLKPIQQYNRVFYVKDNGFTHDKIRHVYVASAKKIQAKYVIARKNAGKPVFNNSEIAWQILKLNGVNVSSLNENEDREASVVNLPSLSPKLNVMIVNDDLARLDSNFIDSLIQSLDLSAYLELLCSAYTKNWANNQAAKSLTGKTLDKYIHHYISTGLKELQYV